MTCNALQRRGLVEEHLFVVHEAKRIVTAVAFHAFVPTLQREFRALVVVKHRRHPSLRGVALCAWDSLRFHGELASMRICMALIASLRRSLELNFVRARRWLVAVIARYCPMGSQERELGLTVVKTTDVYPRFCVVARFAPKRTAITALTRHPLAKFAMVRIGMAASATAIFKMEGRHFVDRAGGAHFVAVITWNGHVRARQRKLGLSMLGNRKQRTVEVLNGVAAFAPIIVRRGGKLAGMNVFVAVHAVCKLHVVNCCLAGREVALPAFHLGVLAFQRVVRACVFLHPEQRRFPAFDGMALRALSFFLAACKLASVNVLVAVSAIRERKRLLEIAVYVTSGATDLCMLAQQRVFRCRMIKGEAGEKFLPSRSRVAAFATLLEGAFVRVAVTICAGGEMHALESRRPASHVGLVTLRACHLDVKAR